MGQGPGLSPRDGGEVGGAEQVTLTAQQLPAHNHTVGGASSAASKNPANGVPGFTSGGSSYATTADLAMSPQMVGGGGNGQPHDNMQPYLVTNWCIATEGIYPSRP
jgi:microcystin-dependent protein